jgi:catalase
MRLATATFRMSKATSRDRARNGNGGGSKATDAPATAWAKGTVGGPSGPAVQTGRNRKGDDGTHDEATAGARLARKANGTDALAGAVPFNPLKASEYGEKAARSPQAGECADVSVALVTASTLTERNESAKAGTGDPPAGTNPTNAPLDRVRVDSGGRELTTNQGVPVANNQDSLKVGVRGPTLLEDFILREKITHFDHERIPERVVHARGSGAHGYFECTADVTKHTKAAPFAAVGKRTPVFVRFSTVVGERGSTDTARDVRGFAVKFYTDEGNWDLVGNNMPVFFIQDAMKFPDLIHAAKPEPHFAMPQAATAHDTFWDFVSLMPESTHMLMWAMSDRAIPRSYRMMQGFGVHTFRLVNAEGKSVFCKFHWNPVAGTHSLVWDEAVKISGADPDFHRRDLWEAIEAGAYPEWELGLQIFTERQAERFSFDVLDSTKIVPEELVPITPVGRLVLDRNPDNFFAETEQVAFCTAHVVPGVDFTNDPLLQGRLFSYQDTQLVRLGGPNFHQIPINASVAEVHNNTREAFHQQAVHRGRVSYEPNSLGGGCPFQAGAAGFRSFPEPVAGDAVRGKPEKFADHYTQARLFWNSQTPVEQAHVVKAFRFELTRVQTTAVRRRVVAMLANVDARLAAGVAEGLGIEVPEPLPTVLKRPAAPEVSASKALSLLARPGEGGIRTRRIAILVADGMHAASAIAVHARLAEAGAVPRYVGPRLGRVKPGFGRPIDVDITLEAAPAVLFDGMVLPDGEDAVRALAADGLALEFVKDQLRHCKAILALGASDALLEAAGAPPGVPGIARAAAAEPEAAVAEFSALVAKHRVYERESDPPPV